MSYKMKHGTINQSFNSQKEADFYDDTTKRQMYLIIQQFAELLKVDNEDWIEKAKNELSIIKINGIK